MRLKTARNKNVKMKSDGLRYRLTYLCGACGTGGRHYIRSTSTLVFCHACNNPLIVEPATNEQDEKGIPVPDRAGDFYKAHHVKTTR